jgi:uncharacterized protein (TIGR02118 family)
VKQRLSPHGLLRVEVDKPLAGGDPNGPAPCVGMGHLYFHSMADFQKGMGAEGPALFADVPNYTNVTPQIQISEIVEL